MTRQHREALVDHIVSTQPTLLKFLRNRSEDMLAGSWDLVSYSFQHGFEALWDLARADHSGLLNLPLLSLWRQSVELTIKSAIIALAGRIDGNPGHNLHALFRQLVDLRAAEGCCDDDHLARNVQGMITQVQTFDPSAVRFRYPADRIGKPFDGIAVDLDELFQAYWIITSWCEGAVMEMRGDT